MPEDRRIETDDAALSQMSIRRIERWEIENVVRNPAVQSPVKARAGVEKWRFLGSPSPGRRIEVVALKRHDTGVYRILSAREV